MENLITVLKKYKIDRKFINLNHVVGTIIPPQFFFHHINMIIICIKSYNYFMIISELFENYSFFLEIPIFNNGF